jgi:hypothetical protein
MSRHYEETTALRLCDGEVCARCGKCEKCGKMTRPVHEGNCACPNPAETHLYCPDCKAHMIASTLAQVPPEEPSHAH